MCFLGLVAIIACGQGPWDVSNSTDRAAMKVQIKQSLTTNDCATAILLSTQIYNSTYVDNESRMLYASAQACNMGLQLFPLLDEISSSNFSTQDAIIRTFVRSFPSSSADSRTVSAGLAQDAVQSILNNGVVTAPVDQILFNSFNTGSVVFSDRTLDANSYLIFVSMGELGTVFNRYGYVAGDTAVAHSYGKGINLTWTTEALVTADTTGSACQVSSGFLNLFDGINAVISYLGGSTSTQLQKVLTLLQTAVTTGGVAYCQSVGHTATSCDAALRRLRYRGACAELTAAAAVTAGIVQGVNAAWLP